MNNGKKYIEEDKKAYEMERLSFCNKVLTNLAKGWLGPRIAKDTLAERKYAVRSVEKWNDDLLIYASLCVMRIAKDTGAIVQSRVYWHCGDSNLVNDTSKSVVKYYAIDEEEALNRLEEPPVHPLNREEK